MNRKELHNKFENLNINVWENGDCRDQGHAFPLDPKDIGCYKEKDPIDTEYGLEQAVIYFYEDKIQRNNGSVEVELLGDDGSLIKTLYHISEDSNDQLKKVKENK